MDKFYFEDIRWIDHDLLRMRKHRNWNSDPGTNVPGEQSRIEFKNNR